MASALSSKTLCGPGPANAGATGIKYAIIYKNYGGSTRCCCLNSLGWLEISARTFQGEVRDVETPSSDVHRSTEWSGLEGTSVGHLVRPPCRSRVTSEGRSSSSCSAGASSASVGAHCPLSCRWAPLNRVWPRPPDPHPADI